MTTLAPGHTERTCPRCGKAFFRRRGKPTRACPDCGFERLLSVAEQAHAKAGPSWEATVRGQLRYWRGEAERLGLSAD